MTTLKQQRALSDKQVAQFEEDGYFIARDVIDRDTAMQIKGAIRNHILTPANEAAGQEYDPMDPMGNSPEARAARFRKLASFCVESPLIWHTVHGSSAMLRIAQDFLGDDVLLKFNSCFLKPALTGSITPWHQDNGLWRDGETEPFNFWMAIDPATRANGCLQFIPGSHREPIVPHVVYEDSLHGELPRDHVESIKAKYGGVKHIELEPGSAVCWHSNLYHYSPVNTSPQSRIAVAGVYSNPRIAADTTLFKQYQWCLRGGQVVESFPPEPYVAPGESDPIPEFPAAMPI